MKRTLIKNCNIINEDEIFESDILIEDSIITRIDDSISPNSPNINIIDAEGNYIIPGLIDDQVHFREPGLTHAKESDDLDPDFHGYRNLQNGHKIFDGSDSFYFLMTPL